MLTLDTLRRMADRMPNEPVGDSGTPPYRRPDAGARVRRVSLPSVRDEARRAAGLFGFVVVVAVATLAPVGVVATHATELWAGNADPSSMIRTGLWFVGWTLAFIAPFAGFGLFRELSRYRRARARLGESAMLDASGVLRSDDGEQAWSL